MSVEVGQASSLEDLLDPEAGESPLSQVDPRTPEPEPEHRTDRELLEAWAEDGNIARYLSDDLLTEIGAQVVSEYEIDLRSREDWHDMAQKSMDFALQKTQPKTTPWPGAANFIFPMITQGTMEFGARAYGAVVQSKGVVKGSVWGSDRGVPLVENGRPAQGPNGQPVWKVKPGEKRARAERVAEHMSWQLLKDMKEWEPQTDALLHQIPAVGGAARKTFRDRFMGKNRSLFVSLMNLVWNYHAAAFEVAPRHTEKVWLYPHEITEWERAEQLNGDGEGLFLAYDYSPAADPAGDDEDESEGAQDEAADPSARQFFLEQHRRLDLDGDGYPEPYVVTVHHASSKVVQIVARFDKDTIKSNDEGEILSIEPIDQYSLIPFFPNIEGGSYPMGFGHLLRALNEGVNTTLNQMFDAGTLQNSGGGFIGDQLGIQSGSVDFKVGSFKRVATKGQSIRDAVFPLPFPGPSSTLFQLLGILISAGKEIAGIQEILTGDAAKANAPPTTVLALIEQGLTGYTAIIKRVLRGFGSEYAKLFALNRKYLTKAESFQLKDEEREVSPDDYRLAGGVSPIADPTMTTSMQKLGRAQLLMSLAPDPMMNKKEIITRFLEAAGEERIEDLFAPPDPMQQVMVQLGMAKAQAELSRMKASEQKDLANAYFFMAQSQKLVGDTQGQWVEQQLKFMQLQIESTNSETKAAAVAFKAHHDHAAMLVKSAHDHADRAADLVKHFYPQQAGGDDDAGGQPNPGGDAGLGGPVPGAVPGDVGSAMGQLAGQPGYAGVPPLPTGQ